jgi:hypothetical protein
MAKRVIKVSVVESKISDLLRRQAELESELSKVVQDRKVLEDLLNHGATGAKRTRAGSTSARIVEHVSANPGITREALATYIGGDGKRRLMLNLIGNLSRSGRIAIRQDRVYPPNGAPGGLDESEVSHAPHNS